MTANRNGIIAIVLLTCASVAADQMPTPAKRPSVSVPVAPAQARRTYEQLGDIAAEAGNADEALEKYMLALHHEMGPARAKKDWRNSGPQPEYWSRWDEWEDSVITKIIGQALKLDPRPEIPETAQRLMLEGADIYGNATSVDDFQRAVWKFVEAMRLAPWWEKTHYNIGLSWEKLHNYTDAYRSFILYLTAAPKASDADWVRNVELPKLSRLRASP